MADPMRSERVTLRDGRTVVLRPASLDDAEATRRNINLIGAEDVYIMVEKVDSLDEERRWLAGFDGVRNALFLALSGDEVIGAVDCTAGLAPKDRHVGSIGIAIRDGWRGAGPVDG